MRHTTVYLDHMLESIEAILLYTEGTTSDGFLSDLKTQDSVIHRIQLLGQSAKNLPEEIRGKHPEIPWRKIIGMRNIIVHEYLGLDVAEVWSVIENDLRPPQRQLEEVKKSL